VRARTHSVESRVAGRLLAVLIAMTMTTSALAGCGSEDKPKATPSPTSKPSVPPGLDTTPPPKPAKQAETKESAVEYGRYFALLVQHAVRVRSARPLMAEALDQAKCTSCRQISEYVEDRRDEKLWQIGPDLRLGKFSARRTSYGFEVNGTFEYPPGKYVKIDGKKDGTLDGGSYAFQAFLVWDAERSRWRVGDYTFKIKSKG